VLERLQPHRLEARRLHIRPRRAGELAQGRAPPQAQRLVEQRQTRRRVHLGRSLGAKTLKTRRVEALRGNVYAGT
jgi:hypothetical protein